MNPLSLTRPESQPDATSKRKVRVVRIDSSLLGVDDEQVLSIVNYIKPTPMPFAPVPVLGIVSIEGKMFTVLEIANSAVTRNQLLALRGDEQLAIAIDEAGDQKEIEPSQIANPAAEDFAFAEGRFNDGEHEIQLLDVTKLFAGVLQGRERRRRRF